MADRTQSVNANGLESNSQLFLVFCIGYVWQTSLHSDCKLYDDDGTVLFLYLLLPFQSGIAGNDINLELSVRDSKEREKNIRIVKTMPQSLLNPGDQVVYISVTSQSTLML